MQRLGLTAVSLHMPGPQEREAHAATDAQFRALYRDKYAPLKAWLAGAEGEVCGARRSRRVLTSLTAVSQVVCQCGRRPDQGARCTWAA